MFPVFILTNKFLELLLEALVLSCVGRFTWQVSVSVCMEYLLLSPSTTPGGSARPHLLTILTPVLRCPLGLGPEHGVSPRLPPPPPEPESPAQFPRKLEVLADPFPGGSDSVGQLGLGIKRF